MPLSAQDWVNLAASKVSRVMLPLRMADNDTLANLAARHIKVVLRVEEGRYSDDISRQQVKRRITACAGIVNIAAVIIGCEPEWKYDFTYSAPTWGQDSAYNHARDLAQMMAILKTVGVQVVSPGWKMRSISEDDPAQPGEQTWSEITRLQYDACDGNAAHLYGYGWDGPVDMLRVKFALQRFAQEHHKLLWLDEVGIDGGGSLERMSAYIEIADMLLAKPIGRRVTMFCPFVSNGDPGNPPQWDARYILSDPQCYVELGEWMTA